MRNEERFIMDTIRSVLPQLDANDELLVYDDGSNDATVSILETVSSPVGNYKFFQMQQSGDGGVRNVNLALSASRSEIIIFLGGHDLLEAGIIKKIKSDFSNYPKAGLWSGRCELIDEGGTTRLHRSPVMATSLNFIGPDSCEFELVRGEPWFAGFIAYRRICLLEYQFDSYLGFLTDNFSSQLIAIKYGALYSPEVSGAIRVMSGSFTDSTYNDLGRIEEIFVRLEDLAQQPSIAKLCSQNIKKIKLNVRIRHLKSKLQRFKPTKIRFFIQLLIYWATLFLFVMKTYKFRAVHIFYRRIILNYYLQYKRKN